LPAVLRLDREIRVSRGRDLPPFREAVRNAGPAILGRGVVQISSYLDLFLGSLLAIGAVARLRYAQTLYVLPVSLFGASTAAAELPELARERSVGNEALRARVVAAVSRVSFFVVPSFVAFVLLGDVLVAGIYRAGAFGASDVTIVWLTLAAYALGLLASTTTRVYQSAFFALRDTKTPARVAAMRIVASALAGFALMVQFEPIAFGGVHVAAGVFGHWQIGGSPLGPVGLALGAAVGAWLEWTLLHASLAKRIGKCGAGAARLAKTFGAALVAAAAGHAAKLMAAGLHPVLIAAIVVATFGAVYFAVARVLRLEEATATLAALARRAKR
jgi:putative peptidoglycan lipid II flippase